MRLQMCCIHHQLVELARFGREACENHIEYAHPAPANEPVVLCGPCLAGASRQRRPFPMTKIISLIICRSSTLGSPYHNGKYGSILGICVSDNRISSFMAMPHSHHRWVRTRAEHNQHRNRYASILISPQPGCAKVTMSGQSCQLIIVYCFDT